jgi:hypothetical protein
VTGAATLTTLIDAALTQVNPNFWRGRSIIFTSGVLKYETADIAAFDNTIHQLMFPALTAVPGAGDTYVLV